MEFEAIEKQEREGIVRQVFSECKKNVVGALYNDMDGLLYAFDLKGVSILMSPSAYEFMLRFKHELEMLNYYAWAKFLEKINTDDALVRVIDKLELSTPRRNDLSIYRELLRREFEQDRCFYCGRKLTSAAHVDHFIPWSFTKDDKLWNFVLSCPTCNLKKRDYLPPKTYLLKLQQRNDHIIEKSANMEIVAHEFKNYDHSLLPRMWTYAQLAGLKCM